MSLVAIPPDLCPRCGHFTREVIVEEPALLRHGGYGATRQTVTVVCDTDGCGWTHTPRSGEIAP